MKFSKWFEAVQHCEQSGEAYVIATVLGAAGSIPRDQGSKMVITANHEFDTLGGGHLEFKVMEKARDLIADNEAGNTIEHFPLGASLGQCCGGSVTVLFESFIQQGMHLTVFGAGHVAKSLIKILGDLPGQVNWVDNRDNMFPEADDIPTNVTTHLMEYPTDIIKTLPVNSQILVLTHNHQLDYELVETALKRGDLSFIGCIGSETKAQRFQMRLQHKGFTEEQIEQMICPVGELDIPGKLPMQVAVSMAAQLIKHLDDGKAKPLRQGVSWKTIKKELAVPIKETENNL
jgi:xanthine dehydrogenase accessory factor